MTICKTVTFSPEGKVIAGTSAVTGTATVTFGSWETVARDLVEIGWGTLAPHEYCKQLIVCEDGIKMVIGNRSKKGD